MSDSTKVELVFGAEVDASVKKVVTQLQKALESLTKSVEGVNKALKGFTASNDQMAEAAEEAGKAEEKKAKKIAKSTTAYERAIIQSKNYYTHLKRINSTYKEGTVEHGRHLTALNKTEKAYQSNLSVIRQMEKHLATLNKRKDELEQNKEKLFGPSLEAANRELTQIEKKIIEVKRAMDMRVSSSINKSFGYDNIFDKNLRKEMFPELDRLEKKFTSIGKREQWVADYYQYITRNFEEGSSEQLRELRKLDDAFKDSVGRLKEWDKLVDTLQKREVGLTGDKLTEAQANTRWAESARALVASNFGVGALSAMRNGYIPLERMTKAYESLLLRNDEFGKRAKATWDGYAKGAYTLDYFTQTMTRTSAAAKQYDADVARMTETQRLSEEQTKKLTSAETQLEYLRRDSSAGRKKYLLDILGLTKATKEARTHIDRMASSIQSMARYAMASMVGYSIIGAFDDIIQSAAQFDQSLKNLQAITNATDQEVAMLGDEIKRVATETKYGTREVAEGAVIIGQAGYNATETMSILSSTMQLAQGSMSSVAASADLLTTALSSFQLNATDAAMVADTMAAAMNYSKLDIDKLRTSFNYVGPVAMNAGASIQDMAAMLMTLSNAGLRASTIGTSLRNVFSQLASPTAALRKAFANITVTEGKFAGSSGEDLLKRLGDTSVDVVEKFEILNKVLGTSSDLYKMFGLRAAGTVSVLLKMPGEIDRMRESLYLLGEAERMADKQMEGLANRMSNFGAAMEVLAVTVTDKPAGMLSDVIAGMTEGIKALTEVLDGPLGAAIATVASFTAAIAGIAVVGRIFATLFGVSLPAVIAKFGAAVTGVVSSLSMMSTTMLGVVTSSSLLGRSLYSLFFSNPYVAAISGLVVVLGALTGAFLALRDSEEAEYRSAQKNIRRKQEQIGLLRTAINANHNITDEEYRKYNVTYLAQQIPDLASLLLEANSKEEVDKLLKDRLEEVSESYIQDIKASVSRTAKKIANIDKELAELSKQQVISDADMWVFSLPGMSMSGFNVISEKDYLKRTTQLRDKRFESFGAYRTDVAHIAEEARTKASSPSITSSSEAVKVFSSELHKLADDLKIGIPEAAQKYIDIMVQAEEINYASANAVSDVSATIENLTTRLTELKLPSETVMKLFEGLPKSTLGELSQALSKYQKALDEIDKTNSEKKVKDAERAKAKQDAYAEITKISSQHYTKRAEWEKMVHDAEIANINQTAKTEQEKKYQTLEAEKRYHEEQKVLWTAAFKHAAKEFDTLNKTAIFDAKTIEILLSMNPESLKNMSDDIKAAFASNPAFQKILETIVSSNKEATQKGTELNKLSVEGLIGTSRKKLSASRKTASASAITDEIAYESGQISYAEYRRRALSANAGLISQQQGIVDTLAKNQGLSSTHKAEYEKANAELQEAIAKHRLDTLKTTLAIEKHEIDKRYDQELASINAIETEIQTRYATEYERTETLGRANIDRLDIEIGRLQELLEATDNRDEKDAIRLQIQETYNELLVSEFELTKQLAEIRHKIVEDAYKYKRVSRESYYASLAEAQRRNPDESAEYELKKWEASSNPVDGVRLGVANVMEDLKTGNQYIAESVVNFRNSWKDAMDEFVDSWWDGTSSASEIFNNFAENIVKDWQKKLLQFASDEIWRALFEKEGVFGNFLSGLNPVTSTTTVTETGSTNLNASVGSSGGWTNQVANTVSQMATQLTLDTRASQNAQQIATEMMATQSTSIWQRMADGATNLWNFLGNGFSNLWGNIGGTLTSIASAFMGMFTGSTSSMSWLEKFGMNTLSMGMNLFGMGMNGYNFGGGAGSSVGGSLQLSDSFHNTVSSLKNFQLAKGGAFKGINGFSNSIVSSPTLFTYGEHLKAFAKGGGIMGEAGPEAIIPLSRNSKGELGVNAEGLGCVNNIYIQPPAGYTAEETSRVSNDNGGEDIMFTIIKQTGKSLQTPGSPTFRAMQQTFGASQQLTAR